jgi:hypothetical protein
MAFRSRWISLVERNRSSFALIIFIYLCAGEDLPPFGDADEGWQWEIQTDEGWISYWDS